VIVPQSAGETVWVYQITQREKGGNNAVDVTVTGGALGASVIDDFAAHFFQGITGNGFSWCSGSGLSTD